MPLELSYPVKRLAYLLGKVLPPIIITRPEYVESLLSLYGEREGTRPRGSARNFACPCIQREPGRQGARHDRKGIGRRPAPGRYGVIVRNSDLPIGRIAAGDTDRRQNLNNRLGNARRPILKRQGLNNRLGNAPGTRHVTPSLSALEKWGNPPSPRGSSLPGSWCKARPTFDR